MSIYVAIRVPEKETFDRTISAINQGMIHHSDVIASASITELEGKITQSLNSNALEQWIIFTAAKVASIPSPKPTFSNLV